MESPLFRFQHPTHVVVTDANSTSMSVFTSIRSRRVLCPSPLGTKILSSSLSFAIRFVAVREPLKPPRLVPPWIRTDREFLLPTAWLWPYYADLLLVTPPEYSVVIPRRPRTRMKGTRRQRMQAAMMPT